MSKTRDISLKAIQMLRSGEVLSGLNHCHIQGLTSIVLKLRESDEDGMWRIFYPRVGCRMGTWGIDGDFELMPHNHRQDITLVNLAGMPSNLSLNILPTTVENYPRVWEYEFGSALLAGTFTLTPTRQVKYAWDRIDLISGAGLFLPAEAVHTVSARPGDAWLVIEGKLSGHSTTFAYSRKSDKTITTDGLYLPLSESELQATVKELVGHIRDHSCEEDCSSGN